MNLNACSALNDTMVLEQGKRKKNEMDAPSQKVQKVAQKDFSLKKDDSGSSLLKSESSGTIILEYNDSDIDADSFKENITPPPEVLEYLGQSSQSLGRVIGQGACGTVYRLGSSTKAIKIMSEKAIFKNTKYYNPNSGEALTLGLQHPNILSSERVISGSFREMPVIRAAIMPEVQNSQTLQDWILSCPFSASKTLYVATQIADAVAYINAKQIAHRDLKPENIMIDANLKVKVIDFGIARKMELFTRSSSFVGTMAYLSPEQHAQESYSLNNVDAWALGVILYQLAYKQHPFPGLKFGPITCPANPPMPQAYKNIVEGLLHFDVSKRLTAQEALVRLKSIQL